MLGRRWITPSWLAIALLLMAVPAFITLGFWQLQRAHEKELLLAAFAGNLLAGLVGSSWSTMSAGAFFALMGILNLWVAYNFDTDTWVNFRTFVLPVANVVFIMAQIPLFQRYAIVQTHAEPGPERTDS